MNKCISKNDKLERLGHKIVMQKSQSYKYPNNIVQ